MAGPATAPVANDPGCVKTKSDLVVMPSGGRIFVFFRSAHDHRAQNSRCGYTASSFHTAFCNGPDEVKSPSSRHAAELTLLSVVGAGAATLCC